MTEIIFDYLMCIMNSLCAMIVSIACVIHISIICHPFRLSAISYCVLYTNVKSPLATSPIWCCLYIDLIVMLVSIRYVWCNCVFCVDFVVHTDYVSWRRWSKINKNKRKKTQWLQVNLIEFVCYSFALTITMLDGCFFLWMKGGDGNVRNTSVEMHVKQW